MNKICEYCGSSNSESDIICNVCGKNLVNATVNNKNENHNKQNRKPILIFLTIVVILFIILLVYSLLRNDNKDNEIKNKDTTSEEIGYLLFELPNILKADSTNNKNSKYFNLYSELDNCESGFTISSKHFNYYNKEKEKMISYDNAKNYLTSSISSLDNYEIIDNVSSKNINDNIWYYASAKTSDGTEYFYMIDKNNEVYKISFKVFNDDGRCSNALSTIINSLKFK